MKALALKYRPKSFDELIGQDVGNRMNLIEVKVVDEKVEWGKTLRKVVLIVTSALVTLACLAAGLNIASRFFPSAN